MLAGSAAAQDTLRYRHSFKLPTGDNQPGYERSITQNPSNVHSFIFSVWDSVSMVYIVVRSEHDSLEIWCGDRKIKLMSRKEKTYEYGFAGKLPAGENIIAVRTRKTAAYKIYVKGQK
jgi:hypothetical protein